MKVVATKRGRARRLPHAGDEEARTVLVERLLETPDLPGRHGALGKDHRVHPPSLVERRLQQRAQQVVVERLLGSELEEAEEVDVHVLEGHLGRTPEGPCLDGQRPRHEDDGVIARLLPELRLDAPPPNVDRLVAERQVARKRADRDPTRGEVSLRHDADTGGRKPGERAVLLKQAPGECLERAIGRSSSRGGDVGAGLVCRRVEGQQRLVQLPRIPAPDVRQRSVPEAGDELPAAADERR